ncbi:ComE operon protein 2 [Chlamydia trachomatis]|nr:ComE operon protein 2 [Chlamydia trachomatis]SYV92027.1 ComE operon protein 2 [Mesomycoplasma hyorhinis]
MNTVEDAKLYVSLFPCSNCAKVIAQTGITTIYFDDDKYHHTEDSAISRFIFEKSKIKTIQLKKFNVTIEN